MIPCNSLIKLNHCFLTNLCSSRCKSIQTLKSKLRALTHPINSKKPNYTSAEEAVKLIQSGSNIFVHAYASTPTELLEAMCRRVKANEITNLHLHHIILNGEIPWDNEIFYGKIRSNCFFISANLRKLVQEGHADYTPVFLSQIPSLYSQFEIPVDVAMINVSPADEHGFCTMGVNCEGSSDAVRAAKVIIALENSTMPRTFGDTVIHSSQLDAVVRTNKPIYTRPEAEMVLSDTEKKIGKMIAEELIDDEATLQIGIGSIPDAAMFALTNHRNLGVHTELLGDSVVDLIHRNVITNNRKTVDPGKIVTTLAYGTRRFYDFIDNNPMLEFRSSAYTNNPAVIARQHRMVAINSAIEMDITGQIVSESIGSIFYSGFGGQVDFIDGAARAIDGQGKSVIAITSTTKKGDSKIVPFISQGAGVVTTRGHVRYVVTEYGIAQLWGKSVRQRAYEMIRLSHPKHRESLEKAAFKRLKCMPSKD